jgi:beta-aspartyl-peptidase (threonine type)
MKHLVAFLALTIGLATSASGQASGPDQIRSLLTDQQAAWNRHDLEGFMQGYWNSEDLTFFSGASVAHGWKAALDRYRKHYQGEGQEMGKLEFGDLQIEMLGANAAFVRGAWHLTMSDGRTPHGLFTLVLRRFMEGWRIVHDHTSAAEEPRGAVNDVRDAITRLEYVWAEAQKNGKADAVAPLLTEDFVNTDADGHTYGKARLLSNLKGGVWESNSISDVQVTVHGDTAVATGAWAGKGVDGDGTRIDRHERWTETWVKINGKWQCIASQQTETKRN